MATPDVTRFNKYFKNKRIHTTLYSPDSKAIILYNAEYKKVKTVKPGTPISMMVKVFDNILPVSINKEEYYVQFANIQRPLPKTATNLKPQTFKGITDKRLSADKLTEMLYVQIQERDDIPDDVKLFLLKLLQQKAKKDDWNYLTSSQNEIIKDFGEIIGAIILAKSKQFGKNPEILLPKAGNEPVIDYYFYINDKKYSISAKSGSTPSTNTLKITNVFENINKMDYDKTFIKLMGVIAHDSIVAAPIRLFDMLYKTNFMEEWHNIKQTDLSKKLTATDKLYYKKIIDKCHKTVEKYGDLFYYTEVHVINKINSKYKDEIKEMFIDAISSFGVYYAMIEISAVHPNGKVTLKNGSDFELGIVKLRTKNSTVKAYGRIGVQM